MMAQFGRVALRRSYGNQGTRGNKWQDALVRLAFTPCWRYQYAAVKNTADIWMHWKHSSITGPTPSAS